MSLTACGIITSFIACLSVIPRERAASIWPLSTDLMPARTISALYAPLLILHTAIPAIIGSMRNTSPVSPLIRPGIP